MDKTLSPAKLEDDFIPFCMPKKGNKCSKYPSKSCGWDDTKCNEMSIGDKEICTTTNCLEYLGDKSGCEKTDDCTWCETEDDCVSYVCSNKECLKVKNLYGDYTTSSSCKESCNSSPTPPSPTPPSPKPPSKQSKKSKKSHLLLWLIPLILIGLIFMGIFIYFNFF